MQGNIKVIYEKFLNSPTLNTWLSYSTKALSLFVVLPLILREFSASEISLWYLFATIISLQNLIDIGFKNTFIRFIAYAKGGVESLSLINISSGNDKLEPNTKLIGQIYSSMRFIYLFLLGILFLIISIFGTLSLKIPISKIEDQESAWVAWWIIVFVSCIKLYGNIYANLLDGLNKVALVRRWEALTSIAGIINSIFFLISFKSLLALVIANQLWVVISVFRNKWLCNSVKEEDSIFFTPTWTINKDLFKIIWTPAWRSGVSGIMSNGLNDFVSVLYAQIGNTVQVGSYLLAIRIITQIKEVSMAPFYSKIPYMAQLNSQGRKDELFKISQRGMFLSSLIFCMLSVIVGLFMNHALDIIGSNISFVKNDLWLLIVFAFFIHRLGAMHIQLYSTSNHIISHIADGVSGMIFIFFSYLLIPYLGLYAIPTAMICGYVGFYLWYSAIHSYRYLNVSMIDFEKKASLIPTLFLLLYVTLEIIFR